MSGINAPAAKRAAITLLQAQTGLGGTLEGVTVSYSYNPTLREGNREYIYFSGDTPGDLTLSAMKGSGRIKREETGRPKLCIRVLREGEDSAELGEQRIAAIGGAVENIFAANPTESGAVLLAAIDGYNLTSSVGEKGEVSVELDYQLNFQSYLT